MMPDYRASMLNELDCLERLIPEYDDLLKEMSRVIRNTLWPHVDEQLLATFLYGFNKFMKSAAEMIGQDPDLIGQEPYLIKAYIIVLCQISSGLFEDESEHDYEIASAFGGIIDEIYEITADDNFDEIMDNVELYFLEEFSSDKDYTHSIADLLDTFYKETMQGHFDRFVVSLGSIKSLCRGRGGEWASEEDVLAGAIEAGKKASAIGWWNPKGKKYVCFSADYDDDVEFDSTFTYVEKTCCEEIMLKDGETVTFADFTASKSGKKKKLLNLDLSYDDELDVIDNFDALKTGRYLDAFISLMDENLEFSDELVKKAIKKARTGIDIDAKVQGGQYFLKQLYDAVIAPMDDVEGFNPKHIEKCRRSYGILTDFLEKNGCAGICYPSTRMDLIGEPGSNIVLFNAADVVPVAGSLRVKTMS